MTKILIPTAGSAAANETAEYIIGVAARLQADVVVLHILAEDESEAAGQETLRIFAGWGKKLGVTVTGHLAEGSIADQIIGCAEQTGIDLIVMGASKGKVVSEWLSADVMGHTATPVLVIPHEFKTG